MSIQKQDKELNHIGKAQFPHIRDCLTHISRITQRSLDERRSRGQDSRDRLTLRLEQEEQDEKNEQEVVKCRQ